MKKFDRIFAGTIIAYLCMALLLLFFMTKHDSKQNKEYMVEINRIMQQIQTEDQVENLAVTQERYITGIRYMPLEDMTDTVKVKMFHRNERGTHAQIEPLFLNETLQGYLRFNYVTESNGNQQILSVAVGLIVIGILIFVFLLYIRNEILKPFHELSDMPYQLSKGHLKGELQENRNRFFGKFIWGISMLQDTLNDAKTKELKLEKEKKMLLLSLSHDIKTPVNTIRLYAKALEENLYDTTEPTAEQAAEKRKKAAVRIGEHAKEINHFVEEIIKTSRQDILPIEVEQSEFYVQDYINMIKTTYEPKCRLMHVEFHIDSAPNKLLKGDLDRAVEVIDNLMENAFKYGDGKKIHITFYEEEYCQLVQIYNTGTVVEEKELPHLFDSFYRGNNVGKKEGNGLGLYICREIMRKMEGEIFAKREKDGMSFTLVFRE